jgi:hypothetical protein
MGGSKRGGGSSHGSNISSSSRLAPQEEKQRAPAVQQQQLQAPTQEGQRAAGASASTPQASNDALAGGPGSSTYDYDGTDASARLLPISLADGRVTVGDGLVLMDRMTAQARIADPAAASTDMVLLSMAASDGPTAMEDFALGMVSCSHNVAWWCRPA